MNQTGAFCMGLAGGPLGYLGTALKHALGYDDALDAVGVHAVGGLAGSLLTGLLFKQFLRTAAAKLLFLFLTICITGVSLTHHF